MMLSLCLVTFMGCKTEDTFTDNMTDEDYAAIITPSDSTGSSVVDLEDYELAMYEQLNYMSDDDIEALALMFTDEEMEDVLALLPFVDDQDMRNAPRRRTDLSIGGIFDKIKKGFNVVTNIADNILDAVKKAYGAEFREQFLNSGCTDEGAMIMAVMCGEDENNLLLHKALAKLETMDAKLDHIAGIVGAINLKLTNEILENGIKELKAVSNYRNRLFSKVIGNQRTSWRKMAIALGMVKLGDSTSNNDKIVPGYDRDKMLNLKHAKTKEDTLKVMERCEQFRRYMTEWYEECKRGGFTARDLVFEMTHIPNGCQYYWTSMYSGMALSTVAWQNEVGQIVNALRAEDMTVLGTQVLMELFYRLSMNSKIYTGKDINESVLQAEVDEYMGIISQLKDFYDRNPHKDAKNARNICMIPGCQMEFIANDNVNENVTLRGMTFRDIVNGIGGDIVRGDQDWWAMFAGLEKWKQSVWHKNQFNKDTCDMLMEIEVERFNQYWAKRDKNYKTPFVEAVRSHIYPDDKTKKLWPDMVYVFPLNPIDLWTFDHRELKNETPQQAGVTDVPNLTGKDCSIYSGWADFWMYGMNAQSFDLLKVPIHRMHYHCGNGLDRHGFLGSHPPYRYYYCKTNQNNPAWQSDKVGGNCKGSECNCPTSFKNKDYGVNVYLPSPKVRHFELDIRAEIVNLAKTVNNSIK